MLTLFFATSRRTFLWIALVVAGLLAFGSYLQYVVGLEPCPMCIVQRYVFFAVLFVALLGAAGKGCRWQGVFWVVLLVCAVAGAYVAARQSWLQWYPPPFYSCGRDFYGMIEQMPLSQALPRIFAGSGDCTQIDWTFLGGTIANWAFVSFSAVAVTALGWLLALRKRCAA